MKFRLLAIACICFGLVGCGPSLHEQYQSAKMKLDEEKESYDEALQKAIKSGELNSEHWQAILSERSSAKIKAEMRVEAIEKRLGY